MHVKRYHTIDSFFLENLSFLEQEEAVNNLLIGIPSSMIDAEESTKPLNLFAVFEAGKVVFSCVQTPPKNFLVYAEASVNSKAIDALIQALVADKIQAQGVIGPKHLALTFAERWEQITRQGWRINFQQLIYQIDKIAPIKYAPGSLKKATLEDLEKLTDFAFDFSKEAMSLASDRAELSLMIHKKINAGMLYAWEDKTLVSMAGVSRPTRNGITVNYVFTPPAFRGRGYASSCVATMSQLMLRKYNFCCLFTDETNPTSNRIYQKMGYYPIAEFREVRFIK